MVGIVLLSSFLIQFFIYHKSLSALFQSQSQYANQQNAPKVPIKVYVYDIPRKLLQAANIEMNLETCPLSFYSVEIAFPQSLIGSRWYVGDNSDVNNDGNNHQLYHHHQQHHQQHHQHQKQNLIQADYYLIPHYSTCYYNLCLRNTTLSPEDCRSQASDYLTAILDYIQQEYPYWDRKSGKDHLLILSFDWAGHLFGEVQESILRARIASCIHLTLMGWDNPKGHDFFNPSKDISIPPWRDYSIAKATPRPTHRPIFAYFRGTIRATINGDDGGMENIYGRGIRNKLNEYGELDPQHYFIREGHSVFYWHELVHSRFALCPPGWSHWSPRLYDALLTGTIPILLTDDWRLPFNNTLINYEELLIRVPEKQILHLTDYLLAITPEQEISMRNKAERIIGRFIYNTPSQIDDALDSTMQVLALRPIPPLPRSLWADQVSEGEEDLELDGDYNDVDVDADTVLAHESDSEEADATHQDVI